MQILIDTNKLVINRLEAQSIVDAAVPEGMRKAFEEVTAEANDRLHSQIDGIIDGLMNRIRIEILEKRTPEPKSSRTPTNATATSSSWDRAGWARCAAFWAA